MFPLQDPTLIFTILFLVFLAAPLVAGKLRVPDLVLLLLAGAALGPNGFNLVPRNSAITMFGEVGLLYIMFLAGLEIDLYQFARTRKRSVGFGLLTFVIPQGLGTLAVHFLLGMSWPASILMASMFASHTLLSYPIASRLGIHRSEAVTVTVGATIITDTLALMVLAVIVDLHKGMDLGLFFWAKVVLGMAGLVWFTCVLVPIVSRRFFKNVTESGGAQFLYVMAILCGCSFLAHFASMEPIIGAFLVGAAFNRLVPEHSPLMNRIHFVGHSLFIPFFLLSVGMLVDPRVLYGNPRTWAVMGTMVGMVVLTKFLAAWIGGALMGYDRDVRKVMFGLSVVQAAATLAAVLVGFRMEILDDAALNGAIAMIVVTCPLGAWAVDRYGRRMARKLLKAQSEKHNEQRILLLVSKPASAAKLMDLSLLMRDPSLPGGIYPLTIVREETDLDAAVAQGEKLLAMCMAHASSADVTVTPSIRVDINPSDGILRAVRELRANTVFTGWGGELTTGARIFGTVTRNLATQCPSRLMLCRLMQPLNTTPSLRILLPPLAEHRSDLDILIREVKQLAKQVGADLHVYLAGEAGDPLRERIDGAKPGCPVVHHRAATWAEIRTQLFADHQAADLILLPLERRNTVLWTPTLDALPDQLAARFPQANLLVVYPALAESDSEVVPSAQAPDAENVPLYRATDVPDGASVERALGLLTSEALSDDPVMAAEACALLKESARLNPVELLPGIVLLHAHCGQRATPLVLVGKGRLTWPFPEPSTPPRVVLALLSPRGHPPELHLHTLATLARSFHNPAAVERIQAALTARDIAGILAGG